MSEVIKQPDTDQPAKRGEAAWKAQKDSIAARNDRARRAGRLERDERDRRAAEERRAAELRERRALHGLNERV